MDDRATKSIDSEQIIYSLAKRNKELERRLKDEQQAHEDSANSLKTTRQQKLVLSQQVTVLQKDKDALVWTSPAGIQAWIWLRSSVEQA